MKYNFNDNSIVVGYIKELLKNFNLPSCKVYKKDQPVYEGRLYIDGVHLCRGTSNKNDPLTIVGHYTYGIELENITKNFIINSAYYDTNTHEYLGEYLRFIRDYKGINLMPLYNCFSMRKPAEHLVIPDLGINTSDSNYTYWLVPIKFNQDYTIAIDSELPYEITGLIYTGSDEIGDKAKELALNSYKHVCGSNYKNTFNYRIDDLSGRYWKYEPCLKLLIKIPKEIKSSITIIEGRYNYLVSSIGRSSRIIGGKQLTKSSLLELNDGISHPMADKLVEYLLGQAIVPTEDIENNISRVQEALYASEAFRGNYDIWDAEIEAKVSDKLNLNFYKNPDSGVNYKIINSSTGAEIKLPIRFADIYPDCLGYVDKDVEEILRRN